MVECDWRPSASACFWKSIDLVKTRPEAKPVVDMIRATEA